MILTGNKIIQAVEEGTITISPFNKAQITTNSYDLMLGSTFLKYEDAILDPKKDNPYQVITVGEGEGITMKQGDFLLGASFEVIGSTKYVPIIHSKSSIARLGLFVHITADLIDIGSVGTTTFQLYATLPITLYPGMLLGQVSFWNVDGDIDLYQGKYINSQGPQASKMFKNFQ